MQTVSAWDTYPWSYFCDICYEVIYENKWHLGTSGISIQPEIDLGTCFHAGHRSKTTLTFSSAES